MRIILLIRSLQVGGAERQLVVLASGLQQRGYSVKVVVFYHGGPFEIELNGSGIPIVSLDRKGRWDIVPFFFRLVNLIKKEKPDVVYSYMQVANIWAALVKLILPRVKVVWSILASNVDMSQYDISTRWTDKFEALLSRFPNWVICNSRAGLLHVVGKGFQKDRVSVVPSGINTDQFFIDRKLGEGLRKAWGVQEGQKLIGIVGRLDPIKDHSNFLRAAALLLEERLDVRFVCVGVGLETILRQYQKLASSLNLDKHLIWAGKQVEMLKVYNALDILVSSSTSEGLSNVVAEAMACGVPCVVTDVGDSGLLVGFHGEIVIPENAAALKIGMIKMLQRLENGNIDLPLLCRQRIVGEFSAVTMVDSTVQTLKQAI